MKKVRNTLLLTIFLAVAIYVNVAFYPYIFSRKVKGTITAVERIMPPMAIMSRAGQDPSPQMFSFAVGIKDSKTGEILTASTEDRQWAVAREGLCVEAEFFPYAPWELGKWGTYYNARLLKMSECGTDLSK